MFPSKNYFFHKTRKTWTLYIHSICYFQRISLMLTWNFQASRLTIFSANNFCVCVFFVISANLWQLVNVFYGFQVFCQVSTQKLSYQYCFSHFRHSIRLSCKNRSLKDRFILRIKRETLRFQCTKIPYNENNEIFMKQFRLTH